MIELEVPNSSEAPKKQKKGSILPWVAGLGLLAGGLWFWNRRKKEKALAQARLQTQAEAERKEQSPQGKGRNRESHSRGNDFSSEARLRAMGEGKFKGANPTAREEYKET